MAGDHIELTKRPQGGVIDVELFKRRSWPGIAAEFVRIAAPAVYDFKIPSASNQIALHNLYRLEGEMSASGHWPSHTKDLRNKLTYLPDGCSLEGWCRIEKSGSIAMVAMAPGFQHIELEQLLPQVEFEDIMIRGLILRFQSILDDSSLDLPGYAETLGALLAFEVKRASDRLRCTQEQRGGLTPKQVRLVIEYMESHLTEKTTISELAALVDVTRFHFIRSFKKAVGIPPHQFMIRMRVARAKELLAHPDNCITDIAALAGFGTAMQMSRAFRMVVGTTPAQFRRREITGH